MSDHEFPPTTVGQFVLALLGALFAPLLVIVMVVNLLLGVNASHISDSQSAAPAQVESAN